MHGLEQNQWCPNCKSSERAIIQKSHHHNPLDYPYCVCQECSTIYPMYVMDNEAHSKENITASQCNMVMRDVLESDIVKEIQIIINHLCDGIKSNNNFIEDRVKKESVKLLYNMIEAKGNDKMDMKKFKQAKAIRQKVAHLENELDGLIKVADISLINGNRTITSIHKLKDDIGIASCTDKISFATATFLADLKKALHTTIGKLENDFNRL